MKIFNVEGPEVVGNALPIECHDSSFFIVLGCAGSHNNTRVKVHDDVVHKRCDEMTKLTTNNPRFVVGSLEEIAFRQERSVYVGVKPDSKNVETVCVRWKMHYVGASIIEYTGMCIGVYKTIDVGYGQRLADIVIVMTEGDYISARGINPESRYPVRLVVEGGYVKFDPKIETHTPARPVGWGNI